MEEPEIPGPLPGVVAYRLAHLSLRKDCNEAELKRVEELFTKAAEVKPFAALAEVYRVAVLHRLLSMPGNERLTRQLTAAFRRARVSMAANPDVYESDRSLDSRGVQPARLQSWIFNMLELSAYFTRCRYDELLGLGERPELALERGRWVIVGPVRAMSSVRYVRELALQELEDREKQCEGHEVFFRLGPNESVWKRAGTTTYSNASRSDLKILAVLLHDKIESVDDLDRRVTGGIGATSRLRVSKHRLKTTLTKLLGLGRDPWDVYTYSPETGSVELSRDLIVYGAVDVRALRS